MKITDIQNVNITQGAFANELGYKEHAEKTKASAIYVCKKLGIKEDTINIICCHDTVILEDTNIAFEYESHESPRSKLSSVEIAATITENNGDVFNPIVEFNSNGNKIHRCPVCNNKTGTALVFTHTLNCSNKNNKPVEKTALAEGGSSKVTFLKNGKKHTRNVQLNKRGTKRVRYKNELILLSKLKLI